MKDGNKKKPSHSAFANFFWAVKMLLTNRKSAFFLILLLIPIHVGIQFLDIYLPSLVVSEVTAGQSLRHALLSVGAIMLAILLGRIALDALEHIKQASIDIYRGKTGHLVTKKQLSMFYQLYENKDIRDLCQRAIRATERWNSGLPLTDIVINGFGVIENLVGYILFGSVISFANPWLVLLLTVAPVVNILSVRLYNNWEYRQRTRITDLSHKLGYVEELPDDFAAAKDIRIYSMASWIRECYQTLSAEYSKQITKKGYKQFFSRIADLLVILIRDGGAYALLISMFYKGEIAIEEFVLYFAAISSFATWVSGIVNCWNKVHTFSLHICDFRDFVDYPETDGDGTAKAADHMGAPLEIEFDRVFFRYDNAKEDTIHDLSFKIKAGERLALVGLNGAGKTTLVKLLCGLYIPTSGEIRVNGVSLSKFRREDYYKLISPVFQDIRTAFFSLAETVSGTSLDKTDCEKAEQCMRIAGLGEKLDTLPEGIHTRLNKRVNKTGTELSGGETQKLMLARALYKDAPLLILDEPTAALDPIAESKIYGEYNRISHGKTSLFISHRLASTQFCDRILLLKEGRIAEEGTHAQLLALGGIYADLYDKQSCWYHENAEGGKPL